MPGKRKLFLTHAGELAHRLARLIGPQGLVERFVRSYAVRHNRQGLVRDPGLLREFELTIGREALLRMAAEVGPRLPQVVGSARAIPERAAFAGSFYDEFLSALRRALDSPARDTAEERRIFDRDLAMYQRGAAPSGSSAFPGSVSPGLHSPFAERCALLLDPSMMEEARRAAAALEGDLVRAVSRTLARLGLPISTRTGRPRPLHRRRRKRKNPQSLRKFREKKTSARSPRRARGQRRRPASRPRH